MVTNQVCVSKNVCIDASFSVDSSFLPEVLRAVFGMF